MVEQIKDRANAREELRNRMKEEDDYHRKLFDQTEELCKHKAMREAQARKKYQRDLLDQIEYNKLLKVRIIEVYFLKCLSIK